LLDRSSRLTQPRGIEENAQSELEEVINEEEVIEFESDQENIYGDNLL